MKDHSHSSTDFSEGYWENERYILDQIKDQDRIDGHREFSRLLNILSDILYHNTDLDNNEHEEVYNQLKRFLTTEYEKTIHFDLNGNETYVWHISVLTCLDLLKKQISVKLVTSPDEMLVEFREVFNGEFVSYLSKFSNRNSLTRDLGQLLEPHFTRRQTGVSYRRKTSEQSVTVLGSNERSDYLEVDYSNSSDSSGHIEQSSP